MPQSQENHFKKVKKRYITNQRRKTGVIKTYLINQQGDKKKINIKQMALNRKRKQTSPNSNMMVDISPTIPVITLNINR